MNLSIKIMSHDADDTAYLTPLNTATPIEGDHRIGRDSACDIVLPCNEKAVSRHHAEILQRDEQYFFIDLSTNGSYYNNEKNPLPSGELIEIADGDQFHIGHYSLVCTLIPICETAIISPTYFGPSANAMVIDSTTSKHTETEDPSEKTGRFYQDEFANVTPALSKPEPPKKGAETIYQNSPITSGLTEAFTPPSSYIPEA